MKTILTALIALPLTLAAVGCEQEVIDLDTLDAAAEMELIERYDAEIDDGEENDHELDIVDADDPTHTPDSDVDDLAREPGEGDPPGDAFTTEDEDQYDDANQGFVIPPASDEDDDLDIANHLPHGDPDTTEYQ